VMSKNAPKQSSVIPPSPSTADYTEREDYTAQMEANAAPIFNREDPIELFMDWMADARERELNDSNAMSLATVDDAGFPDVRIVLLKDVDEQGFVFYTNEHSIKGKQLEDCAKAALCLHWKSLRRQVRVRGIVERVSKKEADVYFASRARGSQIGAWASQQSAIAKSRAELEAVFDRVAAASEGKDIPRPAHWGGYRVVPAWMEFWRDRPYRLHDRLLYKRAGVGWTRHRLNP